MSDFYSVLPKQFHDKIQTQAAPGFDQPCWVWMRNLTRDGYGRITWASQHKSAHRVAYELLIGPIPDDKVIDHLCRTRACVNPRHMEVVSTRENTMRGTSFAAVNAKKTHCGKGHEFTARNTYVWRGCRICRACRAETDRRRRSA